MAKKQNIVNEPEQQLVQPNPYADFIPISYKMVSYGIAPAPRASVGMVQLNPVIMPLSVMPYATGDQGYYGDDQQY